MHSAIRPAVSFPRSFGSTILLGLMTVTTLASVWGCDSADSDPGNTGMGGSAGVVNSGATAGVGGGSGGGAGTMGNGSFSLLFRDEFDTLDKTRWQLMTHSWSGNLAKFSAESASVTNGELSIKLLSAPDGTVDSGETKPYLGAEVRSVATLTYGRVRARAKFAKGNAVVSSLVTIYTPWPADNWNELDIECLGKDPTSTQFNAQVYTGVLPAANTPVSPTQDPHKYALGFDSSQDYHTYDIEWTPAQATFKVDDILVYSWNSKISLMNLPQNILLTIWASSSPGWAGAVDDTTLGAMAVYDWIELYQYVP